VNSAEDSTEDYLAATLGMPREMFLAVFGAGWSRLEQLHNYDEDPDPDMLGPFPPWYIAGEPSQLMLRIAPPLGWDEFQLAMPRGSWLGVHTLVIRPHETRSMALSAAGSDGTKALVGELLRRRRASFSYCRFCRRLTPPESRIDRYTCMVCAARWLDVVF
jgi:hypothetical protein